MAKSLPVEALGHVFSTPKPHISGETQFAQSSPKVCLQPQPSVIISQPAAAHRTPASEMMDATCILLRWQPALQDKRMSETLFNPLMVGHTNFYCGWTEWWII